MQYATFIITICKLRQIYAALLACPVVMFYGRNQPALYDFKVIKA